MRYSGPRIAGVLAWLASLSAFITVIWAVQNSQAPLLSMTLVVGAVEIPSLRSLLVALSGLMVGILLFGNPFLRYRSFLEKGLRVNRRIPPVDATQGCLGIREAYPRSVEQEDISTSE